MTPFTVQGLRCRVWRNEERIQEQYDNHDLKEAALELGARASRATVAELLSKRPRVNAVEVVDADGEGVVIYQEWP